MEDKDKKILKNLVFAAIKSELENQKLEYDMTEISSVLRQRRNVSKKTAGYVDALVISPRYRHFFKT